MVVVVNVSLSLVLQGSCWLLLLWLLLLTFRCRWFCRGLVCCCYCGGGCSRVVVVGGGAVLLLHVSVVVVVNVDVALVASVAVVCVYRVWRSCT